ncbi:uncharacterized protein LOC144279517 isoform X2 [Eretmochelys imbricata]
MPYRSGFNFLADPWLASVSWPWTSKPAGSELSLTSVCLSVCPGLCHSLRSASFTQALCQVPASGGGRGEGAGGDCWGKPSGSEPEQERRQQLAQGVARLRGELQQLDLQTETAQREVMADEVSLEAAQERIRDAQRRSLLLKAYAARLAKERQQLQGSVAQLRGRLEQLKDISRKAKVELTVGGKLPDLGFAGLEPEVLEGWSRCEELWVKQLPLQAREQRGRAQLASLVQVAPAGGGGLGARDPRQRRAQLHRTWGRVSLE